MSRFEELRDEWIRVHGAMALTQNLHFVFEAAEHRIADLEAERDKWEWVARDACEELAYETHVNPQSPLDYRLANWRPRED